MLVHCLHLGCTISKKLRLLATVLSVAVLVSAGQAAQATDETVSEVGYSKWLDPVTVPAGLKWDSRARKLGQRTINAISSELNSMLKELKDDGVTEVKTVRSKAVDSTLRKYGLTHEVVTYRGINKDGGKSGLEFTFPNRQTAFANTLVTLNSPNCSLRDFNFWDFSTWFQTKCEVVKPSVEKFLRASVAVYLWQGPGNLPEIVAYELRKLRYVLENRVPFTIAGETLTARSLPEDFGSNSDVWLGSASGSYSFQIAVNQKNWTAKVTYLRPNPLVLVKNASYDNVDLTINF